MFSKRKICYCVAAMLLLNGLSVTAGPIELGAMAATAGLQADPMPCADQDDPQAKHENSCAGICDGTAVQNPAPTAGLPPALRLYDSDAPAQPQITQSAPPLSSAGRNTTRCTRRSIPQFATANNPIARQDVLLI